MAARNNPQAEHPVICGRRICKNCLRWRHATDFKWRWQKKVKRTPEGHTTLKSRYKTPTIDTVCQVCRREEERERYANLSPEEKANKAHRAVQHALKRRRAHREQLHYMRLVQSRRKESNSIGSIVPFRMWLLGRLKNETARDIERQTGFDEAQIRRWANGYYWSGEDDRGQAWANCEPTPIYTIKLEYVDRVGVGLGEQDLVERLYPYKEAEDE